MALQVGRDQRGGLEVAPQSDDHGAEGCDVDLLQRVFKRRVQGDRRSDLVGKVLHPNHVDIHAENCVSHGLQPSGQATAEPPEADDRELFLWLSPAGCY